MRGGHLKLLGLSLLALVGVMAVSASAAQAKWLLLLNGESVLEQNFQFTVGTIEFLAPSLGVAISCPSGGKGTDGTKLNGTHTVQTGAVFVTFTKCTDLNFGEICQVRSPGQANGTLLVGGSGSASMEGEKVVISTESSEFANIEFTGAECPLTELNGQVSGSVTFEVLEPLKDAVTHKVKTVKQNVFCGEAKAIFHAGDGSLVEASITTVTGKTAGIHLVGL